MLFNLLHNAIKFSPPDSLVRVVCYKESTGDVCIGVIDRGLGIALEDLPRIFEPDFHTLAPGWPEGTGRGLSTVQRLVAKLGWTCQANNESHGGARFVIRIPTGWRVAS